MQVASQRVKVNVKRSIHSEHITVKKLWAKKIKRLKWYFKWLQGFLEKEVLEGKIKAQYNMSREIIFLF